MKKGVQIERRPRGLLRPNLNLRILNQSKYNITQILTGCSHQTKMAVVPLLAPGAGGDLSSSEVFVGPEALGTALVVDEERAILILLDDSVVHELRNQVHGGLTLALGVLHLSDLRLKDVVLHELGCLP